MRGWLSLEWVLVLRLWRLVLRRCLLSILLPPELLLLLLGWWGWLMLWRRRLLLPGALLGMWW